jgi:hypothetical protein
MSNLSYSFGRNRYGRPQAMLWANNPGTTVTDNETGEVFHLPLGNEIGSEAYSFDDEYEFLILSDHNRSDINFSFERIESRKRMVSGRMRSYHIADKLSVSTSWDMLPSRSHRLYPDFNESGISSFHKINNEEFTVDGGAGGTDMLEWYKKYTGSFWLYLSYDKKQNFRDLEDKNEEYGNLNKYSQVIEVFFGSFSHNVVKRGVNNFDFWDVSVSLEEV